MQNKQTEKDKRSKEQQGKDKNNPAEYLKLSVLIFMTYLVDVLLRYYTGVSSIIPLVRLMFI
jgi:hypothetical protein